MFENDILNTHLMTSPTVKSNSLVIAEWNMNSADNIVRVGNYRYRPTEGITSQYGYLPSFYDPLDEGVFYTGATDADVILDGGIDDDNSPTLLLKTKEKEKFLYSLEDCFGRFRPRSGINKIRYGITQYTHHSNPDMCLRPRYYMADKNDRFKYWTSYRVENNIEYGIGNVLGINQNYINDAAPFVVYQTPVAANRIIVKMQTNVGTINLAPFFSIAGEIQDPLFGDDNKTVPSRWQVDVLVNNQWQNAIKVAPEDLRADGSSIIGEDGYVELAFGHKVPIEYRDIFNDQGQIASVSALPRVANSGDAFLVKSTSDDIGIYYIWSVGGYESFIPEYGWYLGDQAASKSSAFITNIGNPDSYTDNILGSSAYRELQYINGIRVVAEQMNKFGSTFDLIEISPRIVADITDITMSYNISKIASDLGVNGLPVGQLLASTGALDLFDLDQAFLEGNANSIISASSFKNMQVKLYDVIESDDRYYVPIKTMYAEDFPQVNSKTRNASIKLRDLYFYLESLSAPSLFLTNVSLSHAVATLLDSIGFSNYTFKRTEGERDDVIPFFYSDPNQSIAEVLQDLAISTQTAMFFDEYNNLVLMSKNYMMPSVEDRPINMVLSGSTDFESNGVVKNAGTSYQLANIVDISSQSDTIFNDGKIAFQTKYIQKSQASTKQTYMLDSQKTWVYKPVLLWEVSAEDNTKSQNEEKSKQSGYALSAIPLNSDLSDNLPEVLNGELINNIVDFGEGVYYIGRYSGYFYANGEVIRYDAVEYSVPGVINNVWINSLDEYQNYFSKITFNGKMYPTGRVRIFAEPNYKIIDDVTYLAEGPVARHGRGQFGTTIAHHYAGLNSSWTDGSRVRGIGMNSKFLFDNIENLEPNAVEELSSTNAGLRAEILQKKSAIKTLVTEINSLNSQRLTSPNNTSISSSISQLNALVSEAESDISSAMLQLSNSLQNSVKFLDINAATSQAKRAQVTGKIKNFLSYSYGVELQDSAVLSTDTQMVQASALVLDGAGSADPKYSPINHITYVHTQTPISNTENVSISNELYTHFGTRMRILGKVLNSDGTSQEAYGSMTYLTVETDNPNDKTTIAGGSGGIAGLLNAATGEGYYFEIAALDAENIEDYNSANVYFYKVASSAKVGSAKQYAMPQLLWRGVAGITVDNGDFIGQSRIFAQEIQTTHDLAFEYVDNIDSTRTFYLYLNGVQIATVTDTLPIVAGNSSALFIRGTSKAMFENIYSLSHNYAENPTLSLSPVINSSFGKDVVNINESFSKYAISGLVQSTYLSGIGPSGSPQYNIYYDEFGTIMREAAYLNIKYDKAYPALYSRISPTVSKLKSYNVSSFYGGAYGAEFLVFNATDTTLVLDSSTGAPLQIQGIAITQNSDNELTVDEFFNAKSDFSNTDAETTNTVSSLSTYKKRYQDIKNTRVTYGRNEFTIEAPYIQNRDSANRMMSWLSEKIMQPRKAVGVEIFAIPTLQLGDIVTVDYSADDASQVGFGGERFVVYQIDYSRNSSGPTMTVYLSEVI